MNKRQGLETFFSLVLLLFLTVEWLKGNKVIVLQRMSLSRSYTHTVTHTQSHTYTITDRYLSLLSGGALLTSKHPFKRLHIVSLNIKPYTLQLVYDLYAFLLLTTVQSGYQLQKGTPVFYINIVSVIMHIKDHD